MKAEEVRQKTAGRWGSILAALSPDLIPALNKVGRHVPCPIHGGRDGYRMYKDVDQTGGGICNTCGAHPDGFATLMWANGWSFKVTLEAVSDYLGGNSYAAKASAAYKPPNKPIPQKSDDEKRRSLNKAWTTSISMADKDAEPGRMYLAKRGILIRAPDSIRFHKNLWYSENDAVVTQYPALLAMISDASGNPVTIHRTYLTGEGIKAPVASPKKMMSYPENRTLSGGAIRLTEFKNSKVLAISEGLETSLAVLEAMEIPTWCAVNAHLLENFVPPEGVETVIIFADKDRPTKIHPGGHGQESAVKLVKRLWAMGIKATVFVPPVKEIPDGEKSFDWLDVLVKMGKSRFPTMDYIQLVKRQNAA